MNKALAQHFEEHYPPTSSAAFAVVPSTQQEGSIAILLSTTKASPSNFVSARWRSSFLYYPSSSTLSGSICVNVHYYEDGNVALNTVKKVTDIRPESDTGEGIVRKIAAIEKQYQEEVNRSFVNMNEQGFKGLRRQLPVTRQKVEWEKVRGYGLSDNLKGAR
jgi:capping protein (actin filament) muscle Z-line, alpha